MASVKTDAEKGRDILNAFRHFFLRAHEPMTIRMLTDYFRANGLDLDGMESGLNYTRLQGWTENGSNQSATLTEEGQKQLSG